MRKENFEQRIRNKYRNIPVNSVADGVKHIKMVKYYNGRPVRINIVEVNQKVAFDYEVKPATATSTLNSKRTLRSIASNTNSIVAINGGFFKPQTGVPLGTLMIDGKLYTGPIYDRVALGIFEDGYDVGRVRLDAKITGNGQSIKIDNINQPRMLSSYILAYTRDWGSYAPASPQYGVQLQIVGNKIVKASANPLFIPENGLVLVGPKDKLGKLFGAETVDVEFSTNPKWENVKHIISGGPYLVKNGEVYIDTSAQKLNSIGGRNPRTAIGYTRDNDLILITADGREGSSIGMTLGELAYLMKSLGCVNAINLDGGGSTVMYVNGQIVNRPPQPGGIALSNAVVISRKDVNAW
jgi:exopolysaccharide biosynthesis protein